MKTKRQLSATALLAALTLLLVPAAMLPSSLAQAQDSGEVIEETAAQDSDATPEVVVLSESDTEKLNGLVSGLEYRRSRIAELEERVASSDEKSKSILQVRLAKSWIELLQYSNDFADTVMALSDNGAAGSEYWDQAVAELNAHPDIAQFAAKELSQYMDMPAGDMDVVAQTAAYARLFELSKVQDTLFELLFDSMELAKQYEIDVAAEEGFLRANLDNRAENNSVLLELAMLDVNGRQAGLQMLPEDADLKNQLALGKGRVTGLAKALQAAVTMMDKLEMETGEYRQQIIRATGEISSDTFNVEVLGKLLEQWGAGLVSLVVKDGPNLIFKLLMFVVIILVSRKLANVAQKLVEAGLDRAQVDLSQLLRNMVISAARKTVQVLGILIALSQIGISLGPVLAGLGVAGFVIGFALQDTLSNFASGMMILIYRPFDMGDSVEAGGVAGTVSNMSLVCTTILTYDNQTMVVPNNKIWGDVIKNVTSQRTRRVDLGFGISYGDDIVKAERVLKDIVESDARVLKHPEPTIKLHELADSSVNFIVRPWVKTSDYWSVYWDLTREVKLRFDKEQISIPFPQQDLHIDSSQLPAALQSQGDTPV
jgi:small conductance mechanosensitive channel